MKQTLRLAALSLVLGLGLMGAGPTATPPAAAQGQAQPTLPMVALQAGIHLVKAEVADDERKRAIGLMFRESLAPNHGMLFVFREKAGHCFWMRNTLIPLSIAYIDERGRIATIVDMEPLDERPHPSGAPVRFGLEMTQGWFRAHGIQPGAYVDGITNLPGYD